MYLKDGRSLLFKLHKPSVPFVLSSNPIFESQAKNDADIKDSVFIEESEVLKRLNYEKDIMMALDYFKYIYI